MATGSNPFGSSQNANGSEERSILFDMPRRSDQPCDVTFVVKDGKEIKACGNILREASSFFKVILDGDWNESGEGIIRLEFLTEEVMKDILELIHSGSVHISSMERAEDVIAAADFLLLPNRLKDIPGQFCEQTLSNCNCFSIYHYAERYRCKKLLANTTKFIHSNFANVANAEEFLNLSSNEVEQWISNDDINISAEDDVFRIILKWIDHHKNERKEKFQDLFRHVRLRFVSRDCLLNEVSTNEFVKHDDTYLNVVMSILNGMTGSTTDENLSLKTPRNVFQTEALVARGQNRTALIYLPVDDEWYQLPGLPSFDHFPRLLSFKNKLLFFYSLYHNIEGYNAFFNYWTTEFTCSTNPGKELKREKKKREHKKRSSVDRTVTHCDMVSVVEDACIFVGWISCHQKSHRRHGLFQLKLDSNSWEMISSFDWSPKDGVCFVFADNFLYAVGGRTNHWSPCLTEATRFDTIEKKWEKIADIQDARRGACGASVGDSIFIAGGHDSTFHPLQTCEMYNILTNEWQFIANLTIPRHLATMVYVDGMLYVLGGVPFSQAAIVACYDTEKNEWKQKTTVPVSKPHYGGIPVQNACSLRIFKGILNNLQLLQTAVE